MKFITPILFALIALSLSACMRLVPTPNGVIPEEMRQELRRYLGDYSLHSHSADLQLSMDENSRLFLSLSEAIDGRCYTKLGPVEKIQFKRIANRDEVRVIFPVLSTACGEKYLGREVQIIAEPKSNKPIQFAIHQGYSMQPACQYYIPSTIQPNIFLDDYQIGAYPDKFNDGEWTYEALYPGVSSAMRRCRNEMQPKLELHSLNKITR